MTDLTTAYELGRLMGAAKNLLRERHHPRFLGETLDRLAVVVAEIDGARDTSLGMRAEDVS